MALSAYREDVAGVERLIASGEQALTTHQDNLDEATTAYDALLTELGFCPLCSQPLPECADDRASGLSHGEGASGADSAGVAG